MSYLLKICNDLLAYPPMSELGLSPLRGSWRGLGAGGGWIYADTGPEDGSDGFSLGVLVSGLCVLGDL